MYAVMQAVHTHIQARALISTPTPNAFMTFMHRPTFVHLAKYGVFIFSSKLNKKKQTRMCALARIHTFAHVIYTHIRTHTYTYTHMHTNTLIP